MPNHVKLYIDDVTYGTNEMGPAATSQTFTVESGKYTCDIKLNDVEPNSQYSIQVTCGNGSADFQKTIFCIDSTNTTTIQRLTKKVQNQPDSFVATGSGTYYLRVTGLTTPGETITVKFNRIYSF